MTRWFVSGNPISPPYYKLMFHNVTMFPLHEDTSDMTAVLVASIVLCHILYYYYLRCMFHNDMSQLHMLLGKHLLMNYITKIKYYTATTKTLVQPNVCINNYMRSLLHIQLNTLVLCLVIGLWWAYIRSITLLWGIQRTCNMYIIVSSSLHWQDTNKQVQIYC